jgi:hypothetical protein
MFLRWCLVVELGVLISCVLALAQPINVRILTDETLHI